MDQQNPYTAPYFSANPEPPSGPKSKKNAHPLLRLARAFANARQSAALVVVGGVAVLAYLSLAIAVSPVANSVGGWRSSAGLGSLIMGSVAYSGLAAILQFSSVSSVRSSLLVKERIPNRKLAVALLPVIGLIELIKASNLAAAQLRSHGIQPGLLKVPDSVYHELETLIAVTAVEEGPPIGPSNQTASTTGPDTP